MGIPPSPRPPIGDATLAAEAAALGLIAEYRAKVYPVLVPGGIPYFPQRERQVDVELVETHTFSSRVATSATARRARTWERLCGIPARGARESAVALLHRALAEAPKHERAMLHAARVPNVCRSHENSLEGDVEDERSRSTYG